MRGLIRTGGGGGTETTLSTLISGEDQTNNVLVVEQGQFTHHAVAASTTDICGTTGAAGDFLHAVNFRVNGTGSFSLKDGSTTLLAFTGISGVNYSFTWVLDAVATTNWTITNTSGVAALATGRFT